MPRHQFTLKTMLWAVGLVALNVGLAIVTFVVAVYAAFATFKDLRLD